VKVDFDEVKKNSFEVRNRKGQKTFSQPLENLGQHQPDTRLEHPGDESLSVESHN